MTDLIPVPGASAVPQLETNTIALGGTGNPMNMQAQALLNRSALNAQNIQTLQEGADEFDTRVGSLESHNEDVVDPSIARSGVANQYAFGNVKQNTSANYATFGATLCPPASAFSRVNFDSLGNHSAGTVGTLSGPASMPAFGYFILKMSVSTTTSGFVKLLSGGLDIFGDQPNGYFFTTASVLNDATENNRYVDNSTFWFQVQTSGDALSGISVITDTAWSGKIDAIELFPVTATKFTVAGAGEGPGMNGPVGLKVGEYNRGDMAIGDKYALGAIQYDGILPTPAYNVAVGIGVLGSMTKGDENVGVGTWCLKYNEGSNNVALGYSSLKYNTKGQENTAVGYKASVINTVGYRICSYGFWANGLNRDGNNLSAFGWYAGRDAIGGDLNSYFGSQSGRCNKDGSNNTYLGGLAGLGGGATAGSLSYNQVLCGGHLSAVFGTSGVALGGGASVGTVSQGSSGSVALGASSQAVGAAGGSVAIGQSATADGVVSPAVAVGKSAVASGARSLALGESSKALAEQATAVGSLSQANAVGTVSVGAQSGIGNTGQNNVFLGRLAGNLEVNTYTNCTLLGSNTSVTGSNQVQLGGTGTTPYAYVALQIRSDARDKIDARKLTKCIEFIRGLKFKEYRNNFREDYFDEVEREIEVDEQVTSYDADGEPTVTTRKVMKTFIERVPVKNDGSRAGERFRAGVFAQEVKALCEELGIDWAGLQHHAVEGGKDVYTVAYELLIPYLGEATQYVLDRQDELEARLIALEQKA